MGLNLEYKDGQTPLSEEEMDGLLIDNITTHGELDEYEQLNIEKAIQWLYGKKLKANQIITEEFVKTLHQKMFGDVWDWAGEFRLTEKNIGIKFHLIGTELKKLNDDCLYWIENNTYNSEEIAIRYKHRIVNIHCFSNGNGRHSRLIADVIQKQIFKADYFNWGSNANLVKSGEQRTNYLKAIRAADSGDIVPLINFAKS